MGETYRALSFDTKLFQKSQLKTKEFSVSAGKTVGRFDAYDKARGYRLRNTTFLIL